MVELDAKMIGELYGSKRASQSLPDRPFVRTYMQLKNYRMYVDILHIK